MKREWLTLSAWPWRAGPTAAVEMAPAKRRSTALSCARYARRRDGRRRPCRNFIWRNGDLGFADAWRGICDVAGGIHLSPAGKLGDEGNAIDARRMA